MWRNASVWHKRLDTNDQPLLPSAWRDGPLFKTMVSTRALLESDCSLIPAAFTRQGWNKPASLYQRYLQEQLSGARQVLVAVAGEAFVGYLTIQWSSDYASFREKGIPEITDFNVLIASRRKGYGTYLMDAAEEAISKRSPVAGIGVCFTPAYGPAQVLYVRRGYVPDGLGAMSHRSRLSYGDRVVVDDELVLYLTKDLRK